MGQIGTPRNTRKRFPAGLAAPVESVTLCPARQAMFLPGFPMIFIEVAKMPFASSRGHQHD
jgi:hypothetical protein